MRQRRRSEAGDVERAADGEGRQALARLHRFGGDALVRDLSVILLEDMPVRLAAARAAARAGDAGGVQLAAHSMRSSCAQFGAATVAALCGEVEDAARSDALDPVPALLDEVDRRFAAFRGWLAREVPLPSGPE